MRKFRVTNTETGENHILDEKIIRAEAEYLYNNSEILDQIDFSVLENCIEFVKRVDQVEEINKGEK